MGGSQEVIHLNYLVTLKIHHSQSILRPKPQLKLNTQTQTQAQHSNPNSHAKTQTQTPKRFRLGACLGEIRGTRWITGDWAS